MGNGCMQLGFVCLSFCLSVCLSLCYCILLDVLLLLLVQALLQKIRFQFMFRSIPITKCSNASDNDNHSHWSSPPPSSLSGNKEIDNGTNDVFHYFDEMTAYSYV